MQRDVRHHRLALDELELAQDVGHRRGPLARDQQALAILGQRQDLVVERQVRRGTVEDLERDDRSVQNHRVDAELLRQCGRQRLLVGQVEHVAERRERQRRALKLEQVGHLMLGERARAREKGPERILPAAHRKQPSMAATPARSRLAESPVG